MERKRSAVAALLLALTLAIPLSAQEAPTVQQVERALSASPEHRGMWIEMAAAQARAGNKAEAVKWLEKAVARGLDFDFAENPAFAPFLETPEFKTLVEKFRENRKVVSRSKAAFKLPEKDFIPEGITYDPKTGAYFVGSVAKNKIVRVDKAGKVSDFKASDQDGLWAVTGMKVDPAARTLWVCAAKDIQQQTAGSGGLFRFDVDTGKLLGKITLEDQQPHLLNDLAFGAGGEVFVTDSKAGAVYRLRPGKNELEALVGPGTLIYPNGIAASPDGKRLFVADFAKQLSIVDVATGQLRPLPHPETVNVGGIDGLYLHAGSLIAVQNSSGIERIMRYRLNAALDTIESEEILESRNPLFEIPTTGVVVGDSFFYIANSQLRSLDDQTKIRPDAKLEESVVLEVPLQIQQAALFEYDRSAPLPVRERGVQERDGVRVHDITYPSPKGGEVTAWLVVPPGKGPFAGILFQHWGEGDRSEFLDEAVSLARSGAVSLLVDAPFRRPEPWTRKSAPGNPQEAEVWTQALIDLRRGVDLLAARPDVDPKRIAYVGHSFGASLGGVFAGVEKRVKAFVLMAGLPSVSDYTGALLEDRLSKEDLAAYVASIAPLDAVRYVGEAAPAPVFLQFARRDPYISQEDAKRYSDAVSEPKRVEWYDAGHELGPVARRDREEWLRTQLAAGGAEQELRALETARTEAIRAGDAATLEKIYDDDFHGVTSGGQTVDKTRILEVLKRAANGPIAEIRDQEVRIFGETAVVTGLIHLNPANAFRYTHIYARKDGRWRMIAGQSTNIPAAQAQTTPSEGYVQAAEGVRLHYRKIGDGPQTVVIPWVTLPQVDELAPLAEGRTLIFYAPRGRLRSDTVEPAKISFENEIADLDAVRRHFGLEKIALLGWSHYASISTRR